MSTPPNTLQDFWNKVDRTGECWEWQTGFNAYGYGVFHFQKKRYFAHRFAWLIVCGEIPNGLCVLHKCDNRACVRPEHLWLGTKGDNNRDAARKGRTARGDKSGRRLHPNSYPVGDQHYIRLHPEKIRRGTDHHSTRFSDGDIRKIRQRHDADGESMTRLAHEYGVSISTIHRIVRRKNWSHVD